MTYRFQRRYTGEVQGVVLDWAGTTIDYGSCAPAIVFVEVFRDFGVSISMHEARAPMGLYKRDHIAAILRTPAVAARWEAAHGRVPSEEDVERLFDAFTPRQMDVLLRYADPIPGAIEAVARFRARGLKVGSCTGYTRAMMDMLAPEVARRGYAPDTLVCPDDVSAGRPVPWMCFESAHRLDIYPMDALIKIGDTVMDIEEGLNAGMWTIGIAMTGNELGLPEAEVHALEPDTLRERLAAARDKLYRAGAHYVVNALADAPPLVDEINARLARGERP